MGRWTPRIVVLPMILHALLIRTRSTTAIVLSHNIPVIFQIRETLDTCRIPNFFSVHPHPEALFTLFFRCQAVCSSSRSSSRSRSIHHSKNIYCITTCQQQAVVKPTHPATSMNRWPVRTLFSAQPPDIVRATAAHLPKVTPTLSANARCTPDSYVFMGTKTILVPGVLRASWPFGGAAIWRGGRPFVRWFGNREGCVDEELAFAWLGRAHQPYTTRFSIFYIFFLYNHSHINRAVDASASMFHMFAFSSLLAICFLWIAGSTLSVLATAVAAAAVALPCCRALVMFLPPGSRVHGQGRGGFMDAFVYYVRMQAYIGVGRIVQCLRSQGKENLPSVTKYSSIYHRLLFVQQQ